MTHTAYLEYNLMTLLCPYFIAFATQSDDSTMSVFYCVAFIICIFGVKTLLDYTNLFYPNDYKRNGKTIFKHFKD